MANLWDDVKKFVKQGATAAVDRIEEETTLWKIQREISNLKNAVDTQKMELGGYVYETLKSTPETQFATDEKVTGFLTEIDNLLAKAAEKQSEYDQCKKDADSKRSQA